MTPDDLIPALGVSRETLDRLRAYVEVLTFWAARINLVAASTLPQVWSRHVFDSAQLMPLLPPGTRTLVDFGTGAGFPGLVLAICGVPDVHLIENNQKKCGFLREAARAAGASVTLHPCKIEAVAPFPADVVTSRALAALPDLLSLAAPFLAPGRGQALFLKGARVDDELTAAGRTWNMRVERITSRSDPSGTIVRIQDLARVDSHD